MTVQPDSVPAPTTARRVQRLARSIGFYVLVYGATFLVLSPLIWMVQLSLNWMWLHEFIRNPGSWFAGVSLGQYRQAIQATLFPRLLWNSLLVTTVSTTVSVAFSVFGAYSISRLEFPGRKLIGGSLLVFPAIPQAVIVIPLYLIMLKVGLFNHHLGLIIAYVAFTLPFTTWLLRSFLGDVPPWLEEAAMIDGCTRLGAFLRVFLPVAKAPIGATFIFGWIFAYNEYLFALVLLFDAEKQTLPVGVAAGNAGSPMAASVLASLPMLAMFLLVRRYALGSQYGFIGQ